MSIRDGAPPQPARTWLTGPWAALVVLCLAQCATVLNFQGAAISLPAIAAGLGLSATTAQWLVSANALAFGGLLLPAGRAADLFGHRRCFMAGVALLAAASLGVALAPAASWLIAGRALQGVGTALAAPAALALLAASYPAGPARHRALAAWGIAGPLGGVIAVLLGSALVESFGWRAMFLLAAPLSLLPLALAPRVFPGAGVRGAGRLDLGQALVGTAGVALLVYALGETTRAGLASLATLAPLALSAALLALFVRRERRAPTPLVPAALFGSDEVRRAAGVGFFLGAATNTPVVFYALYLQQLHGASTFTTGLGFIPCNLAIIAGSTLAGRLVGRRGFPFTMTAGMALIVAGLLVTTRLTVESSYALVFLPGFLLMGFGLGLVQVGIVGATAAGATEAAQGTAAGLVATTSQVGTAVGLAVMVAAAAAFGAADPAQVVAGIRAAFLVAAALAVVGGMIAWRRSQPGAAPAAARRQANREPAPS